MHRDLISEPEEITMKTSKIALLSLFLTAALALTMVHSAAAQSPREVGRPYPDASTPKPIDLGQLSQVSGTTPISFTIALKLRELSEAESLLTAIHTAGNSQYHRFLTAAEFASRFGPTQSDVAQVIAALGAHGLTAEQTTTTTLRVTGLPADVEQAFGVTLHSYRVAAQGGAPAYTFHAPLARTTIPREISGAISGVAGLDDRPSLRPRSMQTPQIAVKPRAIAVPSATGNPLGSLTVADFAAQYDVQPLYKQGITGKGRTLGIVTFASFTPSDAFSYWSALGLSVNANRLSIVNVDGGPGLPSDKSGSGETTIDVEQSGGIAPGANIIVYQAPNTNQAFVDAFAAAVDTNVAQSLSVSWGFWEWGNNLENSPVTDPFSGQTVGLTQALHELFVRAAIQGQTLFAASGDGGAYDANNDFGCSPESTPSCSLTLSVDNPANDTAITAAGGTTLPGTQEYCLNSACTPPYYTISLSDERVWGWDYLDGLCKALGVPDPIACGIFPGGSGGGVSILSRRPLYQDGLAGIQLSQRGQNFVYDGSLVYKLPANYPGRNVPDISFNADPETGYELYYTSSVHGFAVESFWGGTSFVAPQLNGVTALLGQYLHGRRLGLLNFPLYALALTNHAYGGHGAPIHVISHGDNWFYSGRNGYSPAAGLGTLDVANFAKELGNN
jgi:subtilase family serine protease